MAQIALPQMTRKLKTLKMIEVDMQCSSLMLRLVSCTKISSISLFLNVTEAESWPLLIRRFGHQLKELKLISDSIVVDKIIADYLLDFLNPATLNTLTINLPSNTLLAQFCKTFKRITHLDVTLDECLSVKILDLLPGLKKLRFASDIPLIDSNFLVSSSAEKPYNQLEQYDVECPIRVYNKVLESYEINEFRFSRQFN